MNQFLTVFSVHYRFSVFLEINDDDDDYKPSLSLSISLSSHSLFILYLRKG